MKSFFIFSKFLLIPWFKLYDWLIKESIMKNFIQRFSGPKSLNHFSLSGACYQICQSFWAFFIDANLLDLLEICLYLRPETHVFQYFPVFFHMFRVFHQTAPKFSEFLLLFISRKMRFCHNLCTILIFFLELFAYQQILIEFSIANSVFAIYSFIVVQCYQNDEIKY